MLSSDKITQAIAVKAQWKNALGVMQDAGSVACNFVAAEGTWEFGKINGGSISWGDPDALLERPDAKIAVRAKLQCKRIDGTNDPVDGHDLHLAFGDLIPNADMVYGGNVPSPPRSSFTMYFTDGSGAPLLMDGTVDPTHPAPGFAWPAFVSVQTGSDGYAPVVYLTAGPLVHRCAGVSLRLLEATQVH